MIVWVSLFNVTMYMIVLVLFFNDQHTNLCLSRGILLIVPP